MEADLTSMLCCAKTHSDVAEGRQVVLRSLSIGLMPHNWFLKKTRGKSLSCQRLRCRSHFDDGDEFADIRLHRSE